MRRFDIRPFETLQEYRACVELQKQVWGGDFSERVPLAILKISRRLGGVASGAWDAAGELAGFVFGLTGVDGDELVHWSDMLAVRSGLRDGGLGTRLKVHQREVLLKRDVRRARWTFDPLESRNAYLNLHKLGAVAREYEEDMYGRTGSPLHRAIGTDRFVADWAMDSDRVRRRLAGSAGPASDRPTDAVPALEVDHREEGPIPGSRVATPDGRAVLVPVPAEIQAIVRSDPEAAARWREATRPIFRAFLQAGYVVRELFRDRRQPLSHYLLGPPRERP